MARDDFLRSLNEAIRLIQAGTPEQARPILHELSRAQPPTRRLAGWQQRRRMMLSASRRCGASWRSIRACTQARAAQLPDGRMPCRLRRPSASLPQVKLSEIRLPALRLPPNYWQNLQTALIIVLVGVAAAPVIVLLAGRVVLPALTPPSATPAATFTRTPRRSAQPDAAPTLRPCRLQPRTPMPTVTPPCQHRRPLANATPDLTRACLRARPRLPTAPADRHAGADRDTGAKPNRSKQHAQSDINAHLRQRRAITGRSSAPRADRRPTQRHAAKSARTLAVCFCQFPQLARRFDSARWQHGQNHSSAPARPYGLS